MCEIILHACGDCRKTSYVDMNHCEPVRKQLSRETDEDTIFEIYQAFVWSPLEGCDGLLIHPTIQSSPCSVHRPCVLRSAEEQLSEGQRRRPLYYQRSDYNSDSGPSLGGRQQLAIRTPENLDLTSSSSSNLSSSLESGSTLIINPRSESPSSSASPPYVSQPPRMDGEEMDTGWNTNSTITFGDATPSIWRRGGLYTRTLYHGNLGRSVYQVNISSDNPEPIEVFAGGVDERHGRSGNEVLD